MSCKPFTGEFHEVGKEIGKIEFVDNAEESKAQIRKFLGEIAKNDFVIFIQNGEKEEVIEVKNDSK